MELHHDRGYRRNSLTCKLQILIGKHITFTATYIYSYITHHTHAHTVSLPTVIICLLHSDKGTDVDHELVLHLDDQLTVCSKTNTNSYQCMPASVMLYTAYHMVYGGRQ